LGLAIFKYIIEKIWLLVTIHCATEGTWVPDVVTYTAEES